MVRRFVPDTSYPSVARADDSGSRRPQKRHDCGQLGDIDIGIDIDIDIDIVTPRRHGPPISFDVIPNGTVERQPVEEVIMSENIQPGSATPARTDAPERVVVGRNAIVGRRRRHDCRTARAGRLARRLGAAILVTAAAACGSGSDGAEESVSSAVVAAPDSEVVQLRIGTNDPADAPTAFAIAEFVRQVEELSAGSIIVEPVWRAAGDPAPDDWDQAVAAKVIAGDLDLALVPSASWDTEHDIVLAGVERSVPRRFPGARRGHRLG